MHFGFQTCSLKWLTLRGHALDWRTDISSPWQVTFVVGDSESAVLVRKIVKHVPRQRVQAGRE